MHLATAHENGRTASFLIDSHRALPVASLRGDFAGDTMSLIGESVWPALVDAASGVSADRWRDRDALSFTAPYRHPRKIWGIGLNYRDHAADLDESAPTQPASFIKADHTIVGPDEEIVIPRQSERTTVEAELGLIIGRECRDVSEEDALDFVWGVTTVLDQTAEDILRVNPRFLTRCKNFPTFFAFGPDLVPLDDVRAHVGSLEELEVTTTVNADEQRSNSVANMTHSPASLVSFHSQMMPLFPGDIISTGTPGAIAVADHDLAEADIPGVGHLTMRVRDQR